ncbi:PHP domain-containing protein [Stigmatella hybrida]|uniref:PHP domain-containing protein n=1 Tax=Stigmatella hybrida TaxID=394097 RepID=UPI001CDB430A|nr:PHP domain-containing protein [Stigmatella hybrida]
MIDLHSHTTASDGQHSPEELLTMAAAAGVTVLAVTDHDTVAGLAAAKAAAATRGVELVPGIELSAFVLGREAHILGHFLRPEDPGIARFADALRTEREQRMKQMVDKMRKLGFPVRMEDVYALAEDAHLGRPHLARVLVEKGWCVDTKDAFDRFLGSGRPAWVDRYRLDGADAIQLIRAAGGTATLAHPGSSKMNRAEIALLAKAGLAGLEVLHADHNPSVREKYVALAREFGLVVTAGSDFHGEKVAPGRHLGMASMPAALFQQLRARASA